jgi:hypothetical protein
MHSLICNGREQNLISDDTIRPSIDKDYKIPHIPSVFVARDTFGKVLFYELKVKQFIIRYYLFDLKQSIDIQIRGSAHLPEIFIPLWAPFSYHLKDHGSINMDLSQYSLRYLSDFEWQAHIPKAKQPCLLSVHFPLDLLESLTEIFPHLETFTQNALEGRPSTFNLKKFPFATGSMLAETQKILRPGIPSPQLKEMFLEYVLRAFLLAGTEKLVRTKIRQDTTIMTLADAFSKS